jgi:ABC-type multidrug transport system fused ATPase/permease subunit
LGSRSSNGSPSSSSSSSSNSSSSSSSIGLSAAASGAPPWPGAGRLEARGLTARHRPGGPLCLRGVSFVVRPGERVGVVGRSGAGKSSLVAALVRLVSRGGAWFLH